MQSITNRSRTWLATWGPILPLLIAEGTIAVGFGALLPILPIYFTQHGVDLPTLGIIVAAWPAARLVSEPLFGWVADRTNRKAMMVVGLLLAAAFAVAPLYVSGPLAFIAVRALAGMSASIYEPAARGYLVDANPPERQGETFGLYGAAQMAGFMIGPAIGAVAAALTNEPSTVFWVGGFALAVSGLLVAVRVPDLDRKAHGPEEAALEEDAEIRPHRLLNVLLVSAIAINIGSYFAGGSYEVVWSLYITSLGGGLDAIGLTFASFALPILVLSPILGRYIDRRGGFGALVAGMAGVAVCGVLYPLIGEIWWIVVLGLAEGAAFALASPALFLLASRGSPPGRSSTAQGLFGAAGTVGTIVASLVAGLLAAHDLRYPFVATGLVASAALLVGLAIGRGRLRVALQPRHPGGLPSAVVGLDRQVAEETGG
jgi:MFS family permease